MKEIIKYENILKSLMRPVTCIANHYLLSINVKISSGPFLNEKIFEYLMNVDKYHTFKIYLNEKCNTVNCGEIPYGRYIIDLGNKTFVVVNWSQSESKNLYSDKLSLTFLGKNRGSEYAKFCKRISKEKLRHIITFGANGCYNSKLITDRQTLDILCVPKSHIMDIRHAVKRFTENMDLYTRTGTTHNLGIFLYGEPGTGKSTVARLIANELNMSVVNLHFDKSEISSGGGDSYSNSIVLIDDIDTMCPYVRGEADEQSNILLMDRMKAVLDFIDGKSGCNHSIIVATTNHIENLDPAVTRKGRFDIKLEFGRVDNIDDVKKMCKTFELNDTKVKEVISEIEGKLPVVPVDLQALILSKI